MATVYLAHDLRHDRLVALKVLHAELARALGPERFLQEIRLAARLQHPHLLSVHDSEQSASPSAMTARRGGIRDFLTACNSNATQPTTAEGIERYVGGGLCLSKTN